MLHTVHYKLVYGKIKLLYERHYSTTNFNLLRRTNYDFWQLWQRSLGTGSRKDTHSVNVQKAIKAMVTVKQLRATVTVMNQQSNWNFTGKGHKWAPL